MADDGIADFNAEMERRKAGTVAELKSKRHRMAAERAALSRSASMEDIARELEGAPFVAGPDDADAGDPGEAADPGPGDRGGPGRGKPTRPRGEIWEDCPVRALGYNGDYSYYLDLHGQLRAVKKHEAQTILHLFGHMIPRLCWNFPQFDKDLQRRKNRFDQTTASMAMIAACSERGLFNPMGAVRGPGAWKDDDGGLIYHCGTHVLVGGERKPPGDYDGRIYPAYPAIPDPASEVGSVDPALKILETAATWRYEHQEAMPMVILGMVSMQMMCGALDWRPTLWLTGDRSYGKSSLQAMIRLLHGGDRNGGMIKSADTTASGVKALIKHSSLPVSIDELEPSEDSAKKEAALIELARIASSGDTWARGSSDQTGASGSIYSAFLFSSILIPGVMTPADRSRLITIHLRPLDADAVEPKLVPRTWMQYGAVLKRILIDRWPSWQARHDLWFDAMADIGIKSRSAKNWAVVLAMADMAMHAELPSAEYMAGWTRKIAAVATNEIEEIGSDAESMLMHLMGQPYDAYRRGELWTIAQWVMTAAALPSAPPALVANDANAADGTSIDQSIRRAAAKRANATLAKVGLRVRGEGEGAALFVANAPIPGLKRLFEGSTWARGVWAQSVRRVVGAEVADKPASLAGIKTRGVHIPLRNIDGMLAFPMDRSKPQVVPAEPMPDDWEDFTR